MLRGAAAAAAATDVVVDGGALNDNTHALALEQKKREARQGTA